ncbi:MAG TPA: hypothetical protein PK200_14105 [Spirochaetota bacterium]|nr:hypothetical protein [Spirochaetota bacterium]
MKTVRTVTAGILMFIAAASLFTGCVDYAPVQDVNSEPDMLKGYIYGNIQMENYFELAVVLVIKNISTGKKIHVKFDTYSTRSRPREVTLISLEPGTYQITKMSACSARRSVFTIAAFDCTPERDFTCNGCSPLSKQFTVERGKPTTSGISGECPSEYRAVMPYSGKYHGQITITLRRQGSSEKYIPGLKVSRQYPRSESFPALSSKKVL